VRINAVKRDLSSPMLVLPRVATLSCKAWVPLFKVKHDDDET
jgi:hypothetical protein